MDFYSMILMAMLWVIIALLLFGILLLIVGTLIHLLEIESYSIFLTAFILIIVLSTYTSYFIALKLTKYLY